MDLTGRHLGKYELLERVGQGGMAYVYKAYQPTIDRFVAVKVLHSHLAEDAAFLERFKREAKGLGTLRHPHIVSVIDFDVDDGWYYMVMDFIHGETLQAVLSRRAPLPVEEAVQLTAQLAGALDYAHRHGRIHRDIKPGNIMFADEAQQHAVITDFGLTRLLDNATITLSGTIAGTPAYMSPEAAQGEKVDARGDIYSLGVVLYEMVTGQRPYQGETPLSVIMKLVLDPLPPALSINPDLPPTVDAIINKATAKSPDERYQTAAQLRQALQDVLEARERQPEEPGERQPTPAVVAQDEQTQLLSPEALADPSPASVAAQQPVSKGRDRPASSRARWLSMIGGIGLLIVTLVLGFNLLNGGVEDAVDVTPVPTAPTITTTTVAEQPAPAETETPAPQAAGSLRFAQPDGNDLRQYTLSLNGVSAPPAGLHYELWFDFAGRLAPQSVAELVVQERRITYDDALVEDLANSVTGVRVSLEPDFDDDPTISDDVVYTGIVEAGAGLDEIAIFVAQPPP